SLSSKESYQSSTRDMPCYACSFKIRHLSFGFAGSDLKQMTKKDEILVLLEQCSVQERREIFRHLRREFPIHPLEADLNTQAEVILEAMARSSDLTMRGIRGIIAEAAFLVDVLQKLEGWRILEIEGDAPYDFLIEDSAGPVRIQVKMQRRTKGFPLVRAGKFVVETQ